MDLSVLSKEQRRDLEVVSDRIRLGIPVHPRDAMLAIEYQEAKKREKKWWQFWK